MVDWNRLDNHWLTTDEVRKMEARQTGRRFEREFFMNWPDRAKRCMLRDMLHYPPVRCVNEAKFAVMRISGEAQDVCPECLPVVCE